MKRQRKNQTGIIDYQTHAEPSPHSRVDIRLLRVTQVLAVWLVMIAFYKELFSIFIPKMDAFYMYFLALPVIIICVILCASKKRNRNLFYMFLLFCLVIFTQRNLLPPFFSRMSNHFLQLLQEQISTITLFPELHLTVPQFYLMFLLLSIPIIFLFCTIMVSGRWKIIAILAMFIPVILTTITGYMPSSLACWMAIWGGGIYFTVINSSLGAIAVKRVLLTGASLLLLIVIAASLNIVIIKQKSIHATGYNNISRALRESVVTNLEQKLLPIASASDHSNYGATTAPADNLKELELFSPSDSVKPEITIHYEPTRTVYYKTGIGGEYTGEKWTEMPLNDRLSDIYTQYPENLTRLLDLCSTQATDSAEAVSAFIQMELSARTVYDYHPGATPADEDFAEYFLFDNRKGFCVHFATTATLMYRMCGIEARYVSGYAIPASSFVKQPDGQYKATPTAMMGHAWCETNTADTGWEIQEHTLSYHQENVDIPNSATTSPDAPAPTPTPSKEETGTGKQEAAPAPNVSPLSKIIEYGFLLLLLSVLLLLAQSVIRTKKKLYCFQKTTPEQGIKELYKRIYDIAVFLGMEKSDPLSQETFAHIRQCFPHSNITTTDWDFIYEAAMRAMFSDESIASDELRKMLFLYRTLSTNTYHTLHFYKKLLYRYIYCL